MASYVFDSFPLLKMFQKERGWQEIVRLLRHIHSKKRRKFLHIMNFAEIIYLVKKRFGEAEKMRVIATVHQLDFEIVSASDETVYQAAELKGTYPLSFGDSFALAAALQRRAILVTGDPEFRSVGNLVKIQWI